MKINLRAPRPIFRKLIFTFWALFIVGLFTFISFIWAVSADYNGLFGGLPSLQALENPTNENKFSSELFAADGTLLGKYFRDNRSQSKFEELSPNLVNALIATEDFRFYNHSGIDLRGLFRVAIRTIILNQDAGGGSTISQQTAKNLFKTRTGQFAGKWSDLPLLGQVIVKVKEWIVAVQLERNFTKKEIMTLYLNTVEFGSNSFGIKVASGTFFNKEPSELEIEEAAVLVGLLQAPTRYSPIINPESALYRRNVVLGQMLSYNFINQIQHDSLADSDIVLDYKVDSHTQGPATYFRSVVRNYLMEWCEDNGYDLFEDGLKIYTTLDSKLQEYAEAAVAEHMATLQERFYEHWEGRDPWVDQEGEEFEEYLDIMVKRTDQYKGLVSRFGEESDSVEYYLNQPVPLKVFSWQGEIDTLLSPIDSLKYYKHFLHAGLLSMEPQTGYIKAWVGGIDFRHFKFDHVQQGRRQAGSTFKPFVYTTAIENGYSPCYTVVDAPATYQTGGDPPTWTPKNSSLRYTGDELTIRQGMARSVNSVTAHMMDKVQPNAVVDLCRRMGISSPLAPVLSLCLGVSDVSVYEMVGAYGTFANHGTYTKPVFITRIEDRNGNVFPLIPETREAINEETAYVMLHMLKGGTEERGGTATGLSMDLRIDNEIGAKTGTTQNASDGWFMGVNHDLITGVWVGGDDIYIHFRDFEFGQGARMAMPIYEQMMLSVYADSTMAYKKGTFQRPRNGISINLTCDNIDDENNLDSLQIEDPELLLDPDDIF